MIRTLLPAAAMNVEGAAQLALYERMVEESLNAFTYPAALAGLHFSLSANTRGLDLQVGGYSDKQPLLLKKIVSRLTDFDAIESQYERVKAQIIREWRNADKRPPYSQLFSELSVAMFTPQWSAEEKLTALESLSVSDMKSFVASLYKDGDARVLVYGNFANEEAKAVAEEVDDLLTDNQQWTLPPAKVVQLDAQPDWW